MQKNILRYLVAAMLALLSSAALAQSEKPNIVIIWGDDIGQSNLSVYTRGMMGYQTPNIDRVANEGLIFTDYYAEQSCTAGRAAFVTGQSVFRTGLSKVGMPGADLGMRKEDPTIAELLKSQGYATASSAKTTWATRTSTCQPITGLTNFTAIFTTSTPRRSRNFPTIPKIPNLEKSSAHAV